MNLIDIARAIGNISPYAALVVLGIYFINKYFEVQIKKQNGSASYLPDTVGSLSPRELEEIVTREVEQVIMGNDFRTLLQEVFRQHLGPDSIMWMRQKNLAYTVSQIYEKLTGRKPRQPDDSP